MDFAGCFELRDISWDDTVDIDPLTQIARTQLTSIAFLDILTK